MSDKKNGGYFFVKVFNMSQARNQGGFVQPLQNFSPPWKNLLDIVQKTWAPQKTLRASGVSS